MQTNYVNSLGFELYALRQIMINNFVFMLTCRKLAEKTRRNIGFSYVVELTFLQLIV